MFGSQKKANSSDTTQGLNQSFDTCVISKGAEIEGKFSSKEDLRLDGRIIGEVDCTNRIVMGESGYVKGIIKANEAVIMGEVDGDLEISGSLTLKSTAKIKGNIVAKLMSVDEGAIYNGECKIGEFAAKRTVAKKVVSQSAG